jgi:hypothetical protein
MAAAVVRPKPQQPAFVSDDVRPVVFALLLFVLACVQGARPANVPIPSALFFCTAYIVIFQPRLPNTAFRIYSVILAYITLVSIRNSLEETGSLRDFLYVGICATNFLLTVCLLDLFDGMDIKVVGKILLVVALLECVLQLLQYLNPAGFTQAIRPLLNYWASLTKSEVFNGVFALNQRTPGSFGGPTVAGFVIYLLFRSAAIALNRRWITYLAIIPITVGGARNALFVFLLWEFTVPLFVTGRRAAALSIIGIVAIGFAASIWLFPQLFADFFLFRTFLVYSSPALLMQSLSVVDRLTSFSWAMEHIWEVLTFGGLTATEFAVHESLVFGIDSELVLRSMQFGLMGFACFVAMNVWTGYSRRDPDWWFGMFFVMMSSLTNSLMTNFVSFPFLILYNLCVRDARAANRAAVKRKSLASVAADIRPRVGG